MPRYLALLRGINVGGRNKVAMADLRDLATALGLADATTYIQSGNLLFSCAEADTAELADLLESEIASRMGVRPAVVVLSRDDLKQVIADNPYTGETNPKCLHAVFRRDEIDPDGIAAVAAAVQRVRDTGSRDDATIIGRTLFLHTPDGFGRSELAVRLSNAKAQAAGTARNWATVTKLMGMLDVAS
ncbi:MAG TPA: DUF1697 domain-containing protein [Streptosporangiaceae bacterium]|jgi:uncharacterized protein (DUF1697 family)|nr:DUF1697 domain-containing protein [Streptosporangiaceae bacterium]